MSQLLDTHTFIWFVEGDNQLSNNAKTTIETVSLKNFVSIASIWEIAIKLGLGKLQLKKPFKEIYTLLQLNNFEILPISFEDTLIVSTLTFYHRDPFDRIIIAQCLNNNFNIITKDAQFSLYNVNRIW
jgi:PIN domain nuclease of toxin-antitoxin system